MDDLAVEDGCEDDHRYLVCWGCGEFGQHSHGHSQDVPFNAGIVHGHSQDVPFNTGVVHRHSQDVPFNAGVVHGHSQDVPFNAGIGPFSQSQTQASPIKMVACGASHTIAVSDSNELYVWGNGNNGQLGTGGSQTVWQPQTVDLSLMAETEIISVSCGGRHSVVLLANGSVVGFGNNSYNQLGLSDQENQVDNQLSPCLLDHLFPVPVQQVSCGDKHTMFLLADKQVICLGNNHYGQLGCGDKTSGSLPRLVKCEEPMKKVTAGANHSLALSESGKVYMWGYGKACHGEPCEDITEPVMIRVMEPVHQVSAGSNHSALVTVSGGVYTWGYGPGGELGLGEQVLHTSLPTQVNPGCIDGRVIGVECGESLTAALTETGDLYFWGMNNHIIDPDKPSSLRVYSPVCLTKHTGFSVKSISCGAWHAAAVISTDNDILPQTEKVISCDKATSTSPFPDQGQPGDQINSEVDISLNGGVNGLHIHNNDANILNRSQTSIGSYTTIGETSNPVSHRSTQPNDLSGASLINNVKTKNKLSENNSRMIVENPKHEEASTPPGHDINFYSVDQLKARLKNVPKFRRSRTFIPEPLPNTVNVSKSSANKFLLPREDTFVSSKTVGFVPLEDLNELIDKDRHSNPDNWLQRQNSSIRSGCINSTHFPRRKIRFSSGKKHLGLSRFNTCTDLYTGSNKDSTTTWSSTYSDTAPVKTIAGYTDHRSTAETSQSYKLPYLANSHESNGLVSLQSHNGLVPKYTRRNSYRRERTIPRLKPIERNIHKVDNLKADYVNSKYHHGHKIHKFDRMKTSLYQDHFRSKKDTSKLNEAMVSRQQSFILYSGCTGK